MTLKLVRTASQPFKIKRRQDIGPEKSCVLDGSIRRLANFSQILIYIPRIVSVAVGVTLAWKRTTSITERRRILVALRNLGFMAPCKYGWRR